jgi:hypothetical protein
MKHIVCFSGGHSSALVAEAVVRRYGRESVVLVNHGIQPDKEDADIQRFKEQVAAKLGLPIVYANLGGLLREDLPDQFDISIQSKGFKAPNTGNALCTARLKTEPFDQLLNGHYPPGSAIIYYGFDDDEQSRIQRRRFILGEKGYETCFPLAEWPGAVVLDSTLDIGIQPPATYSHYKHANCAGCLKGGIQHWYVTWCHRPDVYAKAQGTEQRLGYSILKDQRTVPSKALWLADLAEVFARMKCAGVPDTEHYPEHKFKHYLKQYRLPEISLFAPCECAA